MGRVLISLTALFALAAAAPPPATFADLFAPAAGPQPQSARGGKNNKDVAYARAYNISDPVFTCPKPGYVLQGEDCVFVDTVDARFECPIGYTPAGGTPGRPDICNRQIPPVSVCTAGRLINGVCQITSYSEPSSACPPQSIVQPDGTCVRFEAVQPIERCPDVADRINGLCVEISYSEPVFICPADTVQEGKKCRREIVTFKTKGRQLSEEEVPANAEMEGAEDSSAADDYDLFADLPEHVFQTDQMTGEGGCKDGSCVRPNSTWLPAYANKPTKAPKNAYTEALKWQKIHVQVPVMVPQKPAPVPRSSTVRPTKAPKVKIAKAPAPPQKIVKVQYIPAEKICQVGDRHGGACVLQTQVSATLECPVPLINGLCQRRVIVPPNTTCTAGTLTCPPDVVGTRCQCESLSTTTPTLTCPTGVFDAATGNCLTTAVPKEYCPLGYFLDLNGVTCTKRDVEAAVCVFSVTYLCPDCEKY